jgi:mono/diheme cytochrome c family protein
MTSRITFGLITGFITLTLLSACGKQDSSEPVKGRWYTGDQLKLGEQVFAANCAACHGKNAESIPNWKQTLADGSYPAPPLNGSAHAWHHSISVLMRTINEGGAKLGGKMPSFKDTLSDAEKTAAIAYFQSYWDERVYGIWKDNGNLSK